MLEITKFFINRFATKICGIENESKKSAIREIEAGITPKHEVFHTGKEYIIREMNAIRISFIDINSGFSEDKVKTVVDNFEAIQLENFRKWFSEFYGD